MKTNTFNRIGLSLVLFAGCVGAASAQTLGSTVANFNILASSAITLTGFSPSQILTVPVVGTSPGTTLTLTNATAGVFHNNDATAMTGQSEAQTLNNSLTAPAGATTVTSANTTLPAALTAGPGVTVYHFNTSVTNTNTTLTLTGTPTSTVIFQMPGALALTNATVDLAGGILPRNIYWQIGTGITIVNSDATNRSFPGTAINSTAAADIAVTCGGAGTLSIGRLLSRGGSITLTQSGAGILTVQNPASAEDAIPPGVVSVCSQGDFIYPSPATGASAKFAFCMAESGNVSIKVWNAVGDIVARVEETKASGAQVSPLMTGRLAPGIYLYRIEKLYASGKSDSSNVKKFVVKR